MKKRTLTLICPFILMGIFLILTGSCKKDDSGDPPANTVTDIDGNVYHTVTIGTQVWMVENLRTTRYRDGDLIAHTTDPVQWSTLTTGSYCIYENDYANAASYGLLYNWYAVNTGKLCPSGWHVPTDAEWKILADYLGGSGLAGGKLKEAGTVHWQYPNTGATNETGFTGLPGGGRGSNGGFYSLGTHGIWWSATESIGGYSWDRTMYFDFTNLEQYDDNQKKGLSVRCLKD